MKIKKILFIVVIGLLFLVGGCKDPEGRDPSEIQADLDQIVIWVEEQIPLLIDEDLILPSTHPELGGTIEWFSTDPNTLADNGVITLKSGVKGVVLSYEITLEGQMVFDNFVITVVASSHDDVAQMFEDQFAAIITRDYDVQTNIVEGYTITWSSSNEEVFSNTGKYNKPKDDVPITISYDVTFDITKEKKSYSFEIIVQGPTISEKREMVLEWLRQNYLQSKLITKDFKLPTKYSGDFKADIEWKSSNIDVIDQEGNVTRYPFDRYVSLTGVVKIKDAETKITTSLIVPALENLTLEEKINGLLDAIALKEIGKLTFVGYNNINQTYNFLPFYENVDAEIIEQIIPLNSERPDDEKGSRPGEKLASVEFITIHDTANVNATATAKMHANLLSRGYEPASWHISIDDKETYQSIPFDEVAWHAGDGRRYFGLTDTGVKANGPYPVLSISEDGYYTLNGEKSVVKAPTSGSIILSGSDITPTGIYTEIGENGNYYINNSYYNSSFAKISNHGGNRNSIGIESCVNNGTNYQVTVRRLAKLVAELLIDNNLGVNRVMQHNHFSGKPCPNSIRQTGYWDNFLDLVSMEKFAKEELADVEFIWTSNTDILDDKGMISLDIGNTTELKYSVVVKYNGQEMTKSFTTKLLP